MPAMCQLGEWLTHRKAAQNRKRSSKSYKLLKSYRAESVQAQVSNIHNPNSTPRRLAPPYLSTRTSRETQSLVNLDARRFSSKAIQLLSSKRVNFLISLPDFLLSRNEIGRILCWEMLEESRWTVISYKSTNLSVHRSVSLKYLYLFSRSVYQRQH